MTVGSVTVLSPLSSPLHHLYSRSQHSKTHLILQVRIVRPSRPASRQDKTWPDLPVNNCQSSTLYVIIVVSLSLSQLLESPDVPISYNINPSSAVCGDC